MKTAAYSTLGTPAQHGGCTFQAIQVKLDVAGALADCPLHDVAGNPPPAVLRLAFEKQYDAAWVRARLPRVFGFAPVFVEETECALLDVAFVAAPDQGEPVPFVCGDHHGRACLFFKTDGPEIAARQRIAAAFWALLLANPDDLADFEQMVYHEPSEMWLKIGCLRGTLYCEEAGD
ncbi:MAG: hypothetical protein L0Y71_19405 [Gemmataceae bacterium]|nr:hypothetical protein [Gemmataceae bacterium]